MAEIKTKPTAVNVTDYINAITDADKRRDCLEICKLMEKATGDQPKMWGTSIIGFGDVRYKSPASGREVDWFKMGFAPRKANITLYFGLDVHIHADALTKLGKHKTGVGCLYINKLKDIDLKMLEKMIADTLKNKWW